MKKRIKKKLLRGSKGAVSVFLIIILVPMMTVSCLFVDMSRMRLANAVVHSAGDLAMNTVLTQYDTLLENYYGLFATSQTVDDLLKNMKDYFQRTIQSAGISEKDAQMYIKAMWGTDDGNPIMDILDIALPEEGGFDMTRASGASLCNPILLKGQIVSFMKYRAPINTGLSLLSALKSFGNLEKETDCIDKRTDYYEAEQEVNTLCKDAWKFINAFNMQRCSKEPQFGTLDNDAKTYYRTMQLALLKNGGGTSNLTAKPMNKPYGTYTNDSFETEFYNKEKKIIEPFSIWHRYSKIVEDAYANVFRSSNDNLEDYLTYKSYVAENSHEQIQYRGQTIPKCKWYVSFADTPKKAYEGNNLHYPGQPAVEYKEPSLKQVQSTSETKTSPVFFKMPDDPDNSIKSLKDALNKMPTDSANTEAFKKADGQKPTLTGSGMTDYIREIAQKNGKTNYPDVITTANKTTANNIERDLFDMLQKGSLRSPCDKQTTTEIKQYEVDISMPTSDQLRTAYTTYLDKKNKLIEKQNQMKTFLSGFPLETDNVYLAIGLYAHGDINRDNSQTILKEIKKNGQNSIRFTQRFMDNSHDLDQAMHNYLNACQVLEYTYRSIPTEEYIASQTTKYQDEVGSARLTVTRNGGSGGGVTLSGGSFIGYTDANAKEILALFQDNAGKPITSNFNEFHMALAELKFLEQFCVISAGESMLVRSKLDGALNEIAAQVKEFYNQMDEAGKNLKNASKKLGEIYTNVTSSETSDGKKTLKGAKDDWQGSVNKLDKSSSIAAQDSAELENIARQFKPEEIKKLQERIDNIKTMVDGIKAEVAKCKFGNYYVSALQYYSEGKLNENKPNEYGIGDFRNALNGGITGGGSGPNPNSGTINEISMQGDAARVLSKLWKYEQTKEAFQVPGQGDNYPYLKIDVSDFYSYLYNKYGKDANSGVTKKSDMEDAPDGEGEQTLSEEGAKKEQEKVEGNCKNAEEDDPNKLTDPDQNKSKGGEDITGDDLPSALPLETIDIQNTDLEDGSVEVEMGDTSSAKGASSIAKNLFSSLTDIGEGIRDNIYISDYIMDMFSYSQGPFKKIGNTSSKLKSGQTDITEFKSLTMEVISADNNRAFGSEIEYILYGNHSNIANIAAAYASIYGVRLCFNLIYAFTSGSLRSETLAIATPISAATLGIVPVPLIQAGLLLVLALAESGLDLVFLDQGEKVNLYKTEETWVCSIHGGIKKATEVLKKKAVEGAKKLVNTGVDKLTEALDSTTEELAARIQQEGSAFADDIDKALESTYQQVVGEQLDAAMNEITSAVMSYKELQKYGDEQIESFSTYVGERMDAWASEMNMDSDGIVGKARDMITGKIKSMGQEELNTIFDGIDKSAQAGLDKLSEAKAEYIEKPIEDLRKQINNGIKTEVDNLISSAKTEIHKSISQGGEKLKNTLNGQLDKLCDKNADVQNPTTGGVGSLFAFNYRDYLRLFLVIKLVAGGQEKVLLRTADLIQCNMRKIRGPITVKDKDGNEVEKQFSLKDSACYVNLTVSAHVKPMFLAVPLISECAKLDGSWQYVINYDQKKGY